MCSKVKNEFTEKLEAAKLVVENQVMENSEKQQQNNDNDTPPITTVDANTNIDENDPKAEQVAKEEPTDVEKISDAKPIPAPRMPVPAPRRLYKNPYFGKQNNFHQLLTEKLAEEEEENTGFAISQNVFTQYLYLQCGNFIIFLSFRFYVKPKSVDSEVQKLPF